MSVCVYEMTTDKYLWAWGLADELMIPYLTENNEDTADAERAINENKRVIKQFAKGIAEALDPDKQIDIFALMVKKGLDGKKNFKPRLPETFTPVFSEEQLKEHPELSSIQEITMLLDRMNMAAGSRKGQ